MLLFSRLDALLLIPNSFPLSIPMPDLIAALDNGTSSSKTLWQCWPRGSVQLMLMDAEILEVLPNDLLDSGLSGGRPENDAYIKLPDGKHWVLGMKARGLNGHPPLALAKYVSSVYKICGLLGAIAQTAKLPQSFSASLCALLPYTEYQDRNRFVQLLTASLSDFSFRGKTYSITLESIDVRPEGAGLAQSHRSKDPERFDRQNTLILMLGQRDASLLPFKQGTPQQGTTAQLGFGEFQQDVRIRAALNITPKDMARLPEYLFRSRKESVFLERIARMVVDETELDHKTTQIKAAVTQAQARYLSNLLDWLKNTLGQDLFEFDEVVISGGAGLYFKTELESFFAEYSNLKVFWEEDLQAQIVQLLGKKLDANLAFRTFDVHGVFRVLLNKIRKTHPQLLTEAFVQPATRSTLVPVVPKKKSIAIAEYEDNGIEDEFYDVEQEENGYEDDEYGDEYDNEAEYENDEFEGDEFEDEDDEFEDDDDELIEEDDEFEDDEFEDDEFEDDDELIEEDEEEEEEEEPVVIPRRSRQPATTPKMASQVPSRVNSSNTNPKARTKSASSKSIVSKPSTSKPSTSKPSTSKPSTSKSSASKTSAAKEPPAKEIPPKKATTKRATNRTKTTKRRSQG